MLHKKRSNSCEAFSCSFPISMFSFFTVFLLFQCPVPSPPAGPSGGDGPIFSLMCVFQTMLGRPRRTTISRGRSLLMWWVWCVSVYPREMGQFFFYSHVFLDNVGRPRRTTPSRSKRDLPLKFMISGASRSTNTQISISEIFMHFTLHFRSIHSISLRRSPVVVVMVLIPSSFRPCWFRSIRAIPHYGIYSLISRLKAESFFPSCDGQ